MARTEVKEMMQEWLHISIPALKDQTPHEAAGKKNPAEGAGFFLVLQGQYSSIFISTGDYKKDFC